ncbi:hypothetical protein HOD08_03340 [bacterium]|nr:hypothetical protein [bacterium]
MYVRLAIRSKRYAQALVNVCGKDFSDSRIEGLERFHRFLIKNRFFSLLLLTSSVSPEDKRKALGILLTRFRLGDPEKRLVDVLIARRDIALLDKVILQMIVIGREIRGEARCKLLVSHRISGERVGALVSFVGKKLGLKLVPCLDIDRKLICGAVVRGEWFLWERSVARDLMGFKRSVLARGLYDS